MVLQEVAFLLAFCVFKELWRRGWDSNPRYGSPYARFRGEYFQPLSHLSAVVGVCSLAEPRLPRLRRAVGEVGERMYCVAPWKSRSLASLGITTDRMNDHSLIRTLKRIGVW